MIDRKLENKLKDSGVIQHPPVLTISVSPYPAVLHFTTSREAYLIERARHTQETVDIGDANGIASDFDGGMTHIVGVFDWSRKTLVHELGHVCIKVLERCGVPIDQRTSEVFCYLLDDLFGQCELAMSFAEPKLKSLERNEMPIIKIGSTVRHAFDPDVVRSKLETADEKELRRMLEEALHVICGLRDVVSTMAAASNSAVQASRSQWMRKA